jgi:lipoate-protein ligase A
MKVYDLGHLPWAQTQLVYHAMAYLGREALILVSPAEPYVCLGFHQDMKKELDLDFCRSRSLPVFRREVGGGAVYLNSDQLFWQVVLKRRHPLVPLRRDLFYQRFLEPVVRAYQDLGMPARFKPVNDVIVNQRKVSGTGAGEIGECVVFVGNMIRDFDCPTMAKVLKMPDEAFRQRFLQSMQKNLGSVLSELGAEAYEKWDHDALAPVLTKRFSELLGPLEPGFLDDELKAAMDDLAKEMLSDEWVHFARKVRPGRLVKVRAGVYLHYKVDAEPGGLEAVYREDEGLLKEVKLRGSCAGQPEGALPLAEKVLENLPLDQIANAMTRLYEDQNWNDWSMRPEDWPKFLGLAKGKPTSR